MADLTQTENDIFYLLNRIRADPTFFVPVLQSHLKTFKGKQYKLPGTNINVVTEEGPVAVEEAIAQLESAKPAPPLTLSSGLMRAATDHAVDLGETGRASHEGSNGSRMSERLDRFGQWDIAIAENIVFDDQKAEDIVVGMLVDDGNRTRGHRRNILNPQFKWVGVATGPHSKFKFVTVVTFAVEYVEAGNISPGKRSLAPAGQGRPPSNSSNQAKATYVRKTLAEPDNAPDFLAGNPRLSGPRFGQSDRNSDLPSGRSSAFPQSDRQNGNSGSSNAFKKSLGQLDEQTVNIGEYTFQEQSANDVGGRSGANLREHIEYDIDNDPDWPEGGENVQVHTKIRRVDNKRVFEITKTYFFADGEEEIVQLVEHESI
jgi:uncharacterized protein YkwD